MYLCVMQRSKQIDHLGLISGMIDELGLVAPINLLMSVHDKERDLSVGLVCKALVINDLDFVQRTLYMSPVFFRQANRTFIGCWDIRGANYHLAIK